MEPLASALALLALLAFAASAWGWGRMTLAACRLDAAAGAAYPVALGLAALAAAGGWLNLFGLASAPALWALLLGGWIAALQALRRLDWRAPRQPAGTAALVTHGIVLAAAAVFLALTLLPGAAFNPNDDFHLYFPRPVRMLQSGSLGRNPFDPIGFDSLGGYAFLQAFTLLAFPLRFINAFDAVLAALLALALVAALGKALRLPLLGVLAALVVLASVAPQQVNVSPVYALAAFGLALVPAAARLFDGSPPWRGAVPLGLLLAALVGLKVTAAAFLVPAGLLLLGFVTVAQGPPGGLRAALRAAGAVVSWTAIFLAPWVLLHSEKYLAWLHMTRAAAGYGIVGNPGAFLSNTPLLWGGSVMRYNLIAGLAAAAAVAGALVLLRRQADRRHPALAPLASLCGGAAIAYLLNAFPYDVQHAVRYSAPLLLAGGAGAVLLLGYVLPRSAALAVPLALSALVATLFADQSGERLHNALASRTVLSYPRQEIPKYSFMTRWGLDPEVQGWVRRAQAGTRPGETVLALVACPYHLLFARNPVLTASEFGVSTPWIDLPADADAARIRRFLSDWGVRYVIWQIGAGVPTDEQLASRLQRPYPFDRLLAGRLASFRRSLGELTRASKVLHVDDGLIVLDLAEARGSAPAPADR